jgi:hypothetical protein
MRPVKKTLLLLSFLSLTFFGAVLFFACEKDPCTNQTCLHGGSCGNGVCTCPVGWDGPVCQYRTVQRFLGTFAGSEYCNNGAPVIDSVFVLPDTAVSPLNVKVVLETNKYDTLRGSVNYSSTVATITIPIETRTNFYEIYTATLQSGNKLTLNTYSDDKTNPNAEVIENCTFVGFITVPH